MKAPFSITPTAQGIPFNPVGTGLPLSVNTVYDAVVAVNGSIIFGSYFQYVESLGNSSTTSLTVWDTKVSLTPTEALVSGNYLLHYHTAFVTAAANREVDLRVRQGASTLIELRKSVIRTQGVGVFTGFLYLPSISGTPTFTLEFKVGGTATTATTSQAKLALWRVN